MVSSVFYSGVLSIGQTTLPFGVYGEEASQFAKKMDSNNTVSSARIASEFSGIVIASEMSRLSMADIKNSINDGKMIIAINLPETYEFANVASVERTVYESYLVPNADNTLTVVNSTTPKTEKVVPADVISIITKDSKECKNLISLNDSFVCKDILCDKAIEDVYQILCNHLAQPKESIFVRAIDTSITTPIYHLKLVADYNIYDTGSWFANPTFYSNNDVYFGSELGDSFTQIFRGIQSTGHSSSNEYYRFDITTDHYLGGDFDTWYNLEWYGLFVGHCGPYMSQVESVISTESQNYYSYLLDYDPITTPSGSSANVGLSLSYPPGASWGWSWSIPDVSYNTAYSGRTVTWQENYNQPNYWLTAFGEPWGCSSCSHNSFRTTRSCVYEAPLYNGIYISQASSTFRFVVDEPIWNWEGLVYLNVARNYYEYTLTSDDHGYALSQIT